MSKYSENKTSFKDVDLLVAALVECGYPKECIEVHEEAQHLYGYHGDKRADTAHVIVRRQHVNQYMSGGSSNDIGFKRGTDGTYAAIISDYDSNKHNKLWLNKLKVGYAEGGIKKQAAKKGLRYVGTVLNGTKRQLQFVQA